MRINGWRCNVEPEFFKLPLQFVLDHLHGETSLTTVKHLSAKQVNGIELPLPPLSEQHRIVAKVEELMALCDRLEAAHAQREATRDKFTAASLARLNAPDPETFHDDARFALGALPALTTRPDQIKRLRQTILNLAVRGHLSSKGRWHANLTTLGSVASLQNGFAFKSEWFSKSGTRLLRNANVGHGVLSWVDEVRLPEAQVPEYERFRLAEGDVVLSLDRPFIVTGTKVARVMAKDLPALLLQRVGRFVLSNELDPDYLCLWINSPHFSEQIDPGRSNGVPHISSKQVEAARLFCPPLAEQHRIVAKVDELMALCARLEASLTTGDDIRSRLLDALLAQALAPSAEVMPVEAVRVAAHG
jgi:type I restriction enzyme S subunit